MSVAVRVATDHLNLQPRSSVFVSVVTDAVTCGEVLLKGNVQLLLRRGRGIARSVTELQNGHAVILFTNFRQETQQLTKGTTLGNVEGLRNSAEIAAIDEESSPSQQDSTPPAPLDVDVKLPIPKRRWLVNLLTANTATALRRHRRCAKRRLQTHRIVTVDDALPLHRSPYRISQKEREVIQKQVQEVLNDDIIQPSSGPSTSPVVLIKKKGGTLRFCVDYRQLNAVTKKDVYPLLRIEDTLDRLRHARYFSSMDLKRRYCQIDDDERDRKKNAFVTPDGLYEFEVRTFGLCTAPVISQRVMDTVLAGLKWQSCLVYLDDVIVFSSDFDEHLRRLRAVL